MWGGGWLGGRAVGNVKRFSFSSSGIIKFFFLLMIFDETPFKGFFGEIFKRVERGRAYLWGKYILLTCRRGRTNHAQDVVAQGILYLGLKNPQWQYYKS